MLSSKNVSYVIIRSDYLQYFIVNLLYSYMYILHQLILFYCYFLFLRIVCELLLSCSAYLYISMNGLFLYTVLHLAFTYRFQLYEAFKSLNFILVLIILYLYYIYITKNNLITFGNKNVLSLFCISLYTISLRRDKRISWLTDTNQFSNRMYIYRYIFKDV